MKYLESLKIINGIEELSIFDSIDFVEKNNMKPFTKEELKYIAYNFDFFQLRLLNYNHITSEDYEMKTDKNVIIRNKKYDKYHQPRVHPGSIFNHINYTNYSYNNCSVISFSIIFYKGMVSNLYFLMKLEDDYYLLYDFSEYERKKEYKIYKLDQLSTFKKCKLKTSII